MSKKKDKKNNSKNHKKSKKLDKIKCKNENFDNNLKSKSDQILESLFNDVKNSSEVNFFFFNFIIL